MNNKRGWLDEPLLSGLSYILAGIGLIFSLALRLFPKLTFIEAMFASLVMFAAYFTIKDFLKAVKEGYR